LNKFHFIIKVNKILKLISIKNKNKIYKNDIQIQYINTNIIN